VPNPRVSWMAVALVSLACRPEPAGVVRMAPTRPGVELPVTVGTGAGTDSSTSTSGTTSTDTTSTGTTPTDTSTSTTPVDDGPLGFIGSPCTTDDECSYDGGVCLLDPDFPGGTCSLPCDTSCPDAAGHPVTACIDDTALPVGTGGDGSCLSRCDFGVFPYEGCRPGYGCVQTPRPGGQTDVFACLPDFDRDIGDCREGLAAAGVPFEPQVRDDEHPAGYPELDCHIEAPVRMGPTVAGVDLRYYYADDPARVLVDCETATSILHTAEDVAPLDVVELIHVGTYNCRVIAGSGSLSQHGLGRAIDIHGFTFADGEVATVIDHWEHDDPTPDTPEGAFLYDAVHRWFDLYYWNIILTPEYNEAHDNHFHVDMSDGAHVLHMVEERYLGPAADGQMD
jgi:hypothetical protein